MPRRPLHDLLKLAPKRLAELRLEHLNTPEITLNEHVITKRSLLSGLCENKKIIYFDTNAWKTISDFKRRKTTLTNEMIDFSEIALDPSIKSKCIFPVGISTIFELQSMNDPLTIETISELIDEFSDRLCIAFEGERLEDEIERFLMFRESPVEPKRNFLRRPFEVFGIPNVDLPDDWKRVFDNNSFNKAFYDTLNELPLSTQLKIAFEQGGDRWNNNHGIDTINKGKIDHQAEITNINTAIFIELSGLLELFLPIKQEIYGMHPAKMLALTVMQYWKDNPHGLHLLSARVLSALHGVMRFDKNRTFKNGDIADFSTAASALPIADAFYTDKRLANIINDPNSKISEFCNCEVVYGFGNFARNLKNQFDA